MSRKNRARTRAIRARMKHTSENSTGENYTTAARALDARPRLQLPLPKPVTGANTCRKCAGTGVTDDVVDFDLPDATAVLVCHILCPRCLGCGHREHNQCRARDHADPESLGLYDEDEDDQDDEPEAEQCYSCRGRTWWAMQAFDNNNVYWVRTPCGCTTNLLVPA